MDRNGVFQRERPRLLAVAFRVLGSEADAQDAVQEAWERYAAADLAGIHNVQAWLTTVVTRLCLDSLRRAREVPRRPEELPAVDGGGDPQEVVALAGELTSAMVVVVGELTPPQRVALILHDVFGVPFEEVARVLDTSPASAKKLASRARGRLRRAGAPGGDEPRRARPVVEAFLRAARQGDIDGLVAVLHPDVVRTADPQAVPAGAAQRIRGAREVAAETRALRDNARRARLVTVDGRPGIAVGSRLALVFRVVDGLIVHYDVVADPRRLDLLRIEG
ncbi:sigma-70 family RNA polymerase sigma factor [Actinomadura kijaniata]|uniref:sigma-70 family RNA polymerase sigma factor n=1 Tax=Actinomadura kijaniata TaxID=46161 RepID=UPI003F1D573A